MLLLLSEIRRPLNVGDFSAIHHLIGVKIRPPWLHLHVMLLVQLMSIRRWLGAEGIQGLRHRGFCVFGLILRTVIILILVINSLHLVLVIILVLLLPSSAWMLVQQFV